MKKNAFALELFLNCYTYLESKNLTENGHKREPIRHPTRQFQHQ